MIASRRSRLLTAGECCVEMTTALARIGRFPSYSIVTCDLPSGRRKSRSFALRTSASRRVQEVTMAHLSRGMACSNSSVPGRGITPSVSSISRRSTSRLSASWSAWGSSSRIEAILGLPCASRTISSGSWKPCWRAHQAHTRATAGVESTSTPSKSNSTPRHRISFIFISTV